MPVERGVMISPKNAIESFSEFEGLLLLLVVVVVVVFSWGWDDGAPLLSSSWILFPDVLVRGLEWTFGVVTSDESLDSGSIGFVADVAGGGVFAAAAAAAASSSCTTATAGVVWLVVVGSSSLGCSSACHICNCSISL